MTYMLAWAATLRAQTDTNLAKAQASLAGSWMTLAENFLSYVHVVPLTSRVPYQVMCYHYDLTNRVLLFGPLLKIAVVRAGWSPLPLVVPLSPFPY
jgi:hypothetical protein